MEVTGPVPLNSTPGFIPPRPPKQEYCKSSSCWVGYGQTRRSVGGTHEVGPVIIIIIIIFNACVGWREVTLNLIGAGGKGCFIPFSTDSMLNPPSPHQQ